MSTAAATRPPQAIVRTFRAADVRGALAAIRASLGPEAVILDTRATQDGRFGTQGVEVTAGLHIEVADRSSPRGRPAAAREAPSADPAAAAVRVEPELEARLIRRGMEPYLAHELVRRVAGLGTGAERETGLKNIAARRLTVERAPWLQGAPRVAALVGPPGVGKTTTIAKIAARSLLERKARVALITIDTWRIAAGDHLLRYGEILRIPAFIAKDRAQLLNALERTAGADLVLIDTAGRSQREALESQAKLLQSVPGVTMHLALAVNSGAADLAAAADRYRVVAPTRAILTKTDEAAGPAAVLSAFVRLPIPTTCLTSGQRVPEDIAAATTESLLELVFGSPGKQETTAR